MIKNIRYLPCCIMLVSIMYSTTTLGMTTDNTWKNLYQTINLSEQCSSSQCAAIIDQFGGETNTTFLYWRLCATNPVSFFDQSLDDPTADKLLGLGIYDNNHQLTCINPVSNPLNDETQEFYLGYNDGSIEHCSVGKQDSYWNTEFTINPLKKLFKQNSSADAVDKSLLAITSINTPARSITSIDDTTIAISYDHTIMIIKILYSYDTKKDKNRYNSVQIQQIITGLRQARHLTYLDNQLIFIQYSQEHQSDAFFTLPINSITDQTTRPEYRCSIKNSHEIQHCLIQQSPQKRIDVIRIKKSPTLQKIYRVTHSYDLSTWNLRTRERSLFTPALVIPTNDHIYLVPHPRYPFISEHRPLFDDVSPECKVLSLTLYALCIKLAQELYLHIANDSFTTIPQEGIRLHTSWRSHADKVPVHLSKMAGSLFVNNKHHPHWILDEFTREQEHRSCVSLQVDE